MPYNIIFNFFNRISLTVLYFLHSTSVLSFYIDVVLTLSMGQCFTERLKPWCAHTQNCPEFNDGLAKQGTYWQLYSMENSWCNQFSVI